MSGGKTALMLFCPRFGDNITCHHNRDKMIKTVHTPKYEALIKWLISVRKDRGLTVRELGALIDEPFQFVSKVETGQRKLNVYEFVQYCEALNIDPTQGIILLANA